jgi:hypothetical protein
MDTEFDGWCRRVAPSLPPARERGGGESKEHAAWIHLCAKSRKKLILDVFLVVDYDSDLKDRCSHCRS